jgi:hypothetical protein
MMIVIVAESTKTRDMKQITNSRHKCYQQESLGKVLQYFRAGNMNINGGDDPVIALQKLSAQISNPKNIPLFEFGRQLEQILTLEAMLYEPGLLSEAEFLFQDYMTKLRDYYLETFRRTAAISASMGSANSKDEEYVLQQKQSSLSNCGKAMAAAVPLISHHTDITSWKYDGFLNELETDMTTFIEEISFRHSSFGITTAVPLPLQSTRGQLIRSKIFKHGRWFVVQCTLLLLNFVQNEWVSCLMLCIHTVFLGFA